MPMAGKAIQPKHGGGGTLPSPREAIWSVLLCQTACTPRKPCNPRRFTMGATFLNRRKLMTSLAAVMSAVGVGTLMARRAEAKSGDGAVRKLGRDGKLADGTQMITALITHNGLLYIAGLGATSNGPVGTAGID